VCCTVAATLTRCTTQAAWWSSPTVLWTLFLTPTSRWLPHQRPFPSLFCRQHPHHHSTRTLVHTALSALIALSRLPQRTFLSLDLLIAENHQLQFADIVPRVIAGYLQKGFLDLRSCVQRRRNDFIKQNVRGFYSCCAVCCAIIVIVLNLFAFLQLPGVSLSDADSLHKCASEEARLSVYLHSCRFVVILSSVVCQWRHADCSTAHSEQLRSRCGSNRAFLAIIITVANAIATAI
jgi:hypothetical protein